MIDHLAGLKVADETPLGREAEDASLGAAHLAGKAEGGMAAFGDEHRFNAVAVLQGQEQLADAVSGLLDARQSKVTEMGPARQFLPERTGNIRHLLEIRHALIEPLHHLPGPIPGLAPGRHQLLHFFQGEFF